MKYYLFHETTPHGQRLEPIAVKASSYAQAEFAADKFLGFDPASEVTHIERSIEEFERYYRVLGVDEVAYIWDLLKN